jgi:LacI family fructose operon transcriptional repressor
MSDGELPKGEPKTVDEVARATGCSPTTVRLVLAGRAEHYRIKAETRARIEAYVADHGVVVNHAARSLKLRRSEAVGLIVPDLANPFFARLTAELEERCRRHGLVLLTASTREDAGRERQAVDGLLARGVDGLVVAACRPETSLSGLPRRRRPAVVMIDRAFPDLAFPCVVGDHADSARRLTERLLAAGRGGVEFLCGHPELPSIAARIEGFLAAHRAAGFTGAEARVHRAEQDEVAAGTLLMTALVAARGDVPPVLMCSSMPILEGALAAIVTTVGRLPAEVVIGTFDHHRLLDFVPNRILSVRQDEAGIAERAFARLAEQMDGGVASVLRDVVPGRIAEHS